MVKDLKIAYNAATDPAQTIFINALIASCIFVEL